jgi:hypothetical protein
VSGRGSRMGTGSGSFGGVAGISSGSFFGFGCGVGSLGRSGAWTLDTAAVSQCVI